MRRLIVCGAAATLVATALAPTSASAVDTIDTRPFRDAVTVNGILSHLRVLQRIANENGGTRASGTDGYYYSVEYVKNRLKAAGYTVKVEPFLFPFFRNTAAPTVAQVSPDEQDFETRTLSFSGSGDVTGRLVPAGGIVLPPTPEPSSAAGCEPADFTPAPDEPSVALVQRGSCDFSVKAANAAAAGYDAVLIFNEGQTGRDGLYSGTLGADFTLDLPVLALSFADGAQLYQVAQAGPVTVTVTAATERDPERVTYNVIADSKGGDKDQVLVVGAHLDSVADGPGINDNGSGAATILEIAEELAKHKAKPKNKQVSKVRFAFWGAEESGLLGSAHYVASLSDDELAQLYANLNFDMLGSPNYVRFVYDGDGSATGTAGPPGSAEIEEIFNGYFRGRGPVEPKAFDGRSDYGPFIEVGVPAGGLFSGAEGVKTAEQAQIYKGTAGEPYDPCYHQACDTINNISSTALNQLGDAAAHAVYTIAFSRTSLFGDSALSARTFSSFTADAQGGKAVQRGKARKNLTVKELSNPAMLGAAE